MDKPEYLCKFWDVLNNLESVEDESFPLWVRNILKHIRETVLKDLTPLLQADPKDPKSAGLAIGAAEHIGSILERVFENLPAKDEQGMEKMDLGDFQKRLDEFEKDGEHFERFEEKTKEYKKAWSNHEASEFYQGKSKGLKSLQDEEGNWKGTRLNTELLLVMLSLWPTIEEHFKTRRDVYRLLLAIYFKRENPDAKFDVEKAEEKPPREVGTFKRAEKMLQRIDFNPAKPGRPKKQLG